jgi:hypothetical protein
MNIGEALRASSGAVTTAKKELYQKLPKTNLEESSLAKAATLSTMNIGEALRASSGAGTTAKKELCMIGGFAMRAVIFFCIPYICGALNFFGLLGVGNELFVVTKKGRS